MSKSMQYVVGGVGLLIILLGFSWYLYQSSALKEKSIFEGVGMVVPGGGPYIVFENPNGSVFTVSAARDEAGQADRMVVLDAANALTTDNGVLVAPFTIENGMGAGSYLAVFNLSSEGIPVFKNTAFVHEGSVLPALELRASHAVVARLPASSEQPSMTKYFLLKESGVVEAYALVNADVGSAFFSSPNPYQEVAAGVFPVEGTIPRAWAGSGGGVVRLMGLSGNEIARADAAVKDDPQSESLSTFKSLLSIPKSTLSAAYLSFESGDNVGSITMPIVLGITN